MPSQKHKSYSVTTIKHTKEDKLHEVSNGDLTAALNQHLSGSIIGVSIADVHGKFVGVAKYSFNSIVSAGPVRKSAYNDGCIDIHGRAVGAGTDVHTYPECCPTCSEPPVRAIPGTEKWKIDKETPSTYSCIKNIPYKAIWNLKPETAPMHGVADATIIRTGTTQAQVLHQLSTINYIRELELKSQMCDDCYC